MSHYQVTASKNMTLSQLKQIKADNYVGANGKDYCPFELEARIQEIEMKQAMLFIKQVPKLEQAAAFQSQVANINLNKEIRFVLKQPNKPMFTIVQL